MNKVRILYAIVLVTCKNSGYSLLHIACYRGYALLVAFLVDQPGIDLELKRCDNALPFVALTYSVVLITIRRFCSPSAMVIKQSPSGYSAAVQQHRLLPLLWQRRTRQQYYLYTFHVALT